MYSYKCSDENLNQSMYYGLGFNCLLKTHMLKALILLGVGGIYKKSGLTERGQVISHMPCEAYWDPGCLSSVNFSCHEARGSVCALCHDLSVIL